MKQPDYGNSILNLINSITSKFGLVPRHKPLPTEMLGEKFKSAKRVVVLLVDAMGYEPARRLQEKGLFRYLGSPKKLSSVFPSTTVNVLSTMATAASPIEHGMLGYVLNLKEFGTLANMIEFTPVGMPKDALISRGANPSGFLGVPTIYDDLRNYGATPLVITASVFKESGLSKIQNHNAAVQGYVDQTDMMTKLRKAIESEKFSYIYAYWPMVDAMGHLYGPDSEEYSEEARITLQNFEEIVYSKLPDSVKDETVFLVTADHGQIRTKWQKDYVLSAEDDFVASLDIMPCGEPRMMYLYTKDIDRTIEEGRKFFSGSVDFYRSSELLKEGFFGPGRPYEKSILRIGDLVALPREDASFTIKYTGSERHLKGKHGGLSTEEMDIPLFVV